MYDPNAYDYYNDEFGTHACGCEYAPEWFHERHHDNNYEDTISYSISFRNRKNGVRIYAN